MKNAKRRPWLTPVLVVLCLVALVANAFALERLPNGYYHTGDGVRQKKILFASVDVYAIGHEMKELPPAKSKQAVIDADISKRFIWKMKRDVDSEKIQNALSEAYAMNGYTDKAKIGKFLAVFSKELKENQIVTITYDADKKTTTLQVQGGASATADGVDFMKATWRIWFGKIDQPSLGDALISRLP
ncbi:chalcone isomerase family protein [Pendulispora brunnea]|uniref:Chalcone isomerase family protein n=1 Tax=Pendulispora brunnea TaxID=2905690 RepID=A0ABZ2KJM2_9BACT